MMQISSASGYREVALWFEGNARVFLFWGVVFFLMVTKSHIDCREFKKEKAKIKVRGLFSEVTKNKFSLLFSPLI